jgi:hypothetical protein
MLKYKPDPKSSVTWELFAITIDNHNLIIEATRPQGGASRQGWFDRLTMANRNVILSLSKDPLTPTSFDKLTTPLSPQGRGRAGL